MVSSDSALELIAADGALSFHVATAPHAPAGCCHVHLRAHGVERRLGAGMLPDLLRRMSSVLVQDPAELRWIFNLDEPHGSVYGERRLEGWVLHIQDVDGVFFAKIVLSAVERARWLQQLATFQPPASRA